MLDGKQGFLKSLARMKDGYRNWGAFFIVPLCGGFLSGLVALVGSLPFFILINVKFLARQATMIHVEICSKCHPFYTGQQKAAQARGRIDKFNKKYGLNK